MKAGGESNAMPQPDTKSDSFEFLNTIFKTFHYSNIALVMV
jgi:hypothetical protein